MIELLLILLGAVLGVSGTLGVQQYRYYVRKPRNIYQVKIGDATFLDTNNLRKAKARHSRFQRSGAKAVLIVNGEYRG